MNEHGLDLETATVRQLSGWLATGRLTAVALVRACLGRIAALDDRGPALHAVRALNPAALADAEAADERLRAGERGPLTGIPVLVKDNIDVLGLPTTAGSLALARSYPAADAPLVTALRRAGAVILGKANLTELANFLAEDMPGGYSSLGGQVLNPYDASRTPRGSSAGSAVAVAAGLAVLSVGSETSGSILAPAHANSVVGIKPTVGLVPRTGMLPIASSQDTAGPLTRTVADAAALLTVLAARDPRDPATAVNPLADHDFTGDLDLGALRGKRIGVVRAELPDDERALFDAAAQAMRDRGAVLVPVEVDLSGNGSSVLTYEFKRDLNTYLSGLPADAPCRSLADVLAFNEANAAATLKFGQARALAAQAKDLTPDSADTRRYLADRALDLAENKDRLDAVLAAENLTALLFAGCSGSVIGARAGYPSVCVPAGYLAADRRPFGVTLLGPAWSEPELVGCAYAFEQATRLRRPPSVVNPAAMRRHGREAATAMEEIG
ncbi:amidase family protein [Amycolatopsis rhabdoformis]|uniref:Amidase family protein n=1 Tax=Amycolatopsis rhabdoformis TaxID=1448059 RepID=A0ABZ1IBY3_9PSEU|nr:amidase family protein [Amycolatopsis rhabdoformis]WSE31539.1 amidase family protein [Amycolatopsis rhabdoformis]